MTLLVPGNGEADALQYFVNKAMPENLMLRLFSSNTTPAETDTAASYIEASWKGYEAIELTGAAWGAPSDGSPSKIAYGTQTFTSNAGAQNQANYGYYMTRKTSGRIALAERFADGPYVVMNNLDVIRVTPSIVQD